MHVMPQIQEFFWLKCQFVANRGAVHLFIRESCPSSPPPQHYVPRRHTLSAAPLPHPSLQPARVIPGCWRNKPIASDAFAGKSKRFYYLTLRCRNFHTCLHLRTRASDAEFCGAGNVIGIGHNSVHERAKNYDSHDGATAQVSDDRMSRHRE